MAALNQENKVKEASKTQTGTQESQNPAADIVNKNQGEVIQASPINLLPDEFKPKRSVINLSKKLNRFALAALIIFLILGTTSLISIFVISARANSIENEVDQLTAEVAALEQTEQRLVLIKNRIDQVNQIMTDPGSLYDRVVIFKNIYDNLPEGMQILTANIDDYKINLEIAFSNSSDLARFLSQTVTSDQYQLINIQSLSTENDGVLVIMLVLEA